MPDTAPRFRLACQTITWDNERAAKRDHTVEAVAKAGYEGLEIGARFLDLDRADEFKCVLGRNGIRLIALHTGWNPFIAGGSSGGSNEVDRAIEFAQTTETPFLAMSGKADKEQMIAEAEGLNVIGEKCRKNEMTFCYHNHWWEIEDGGRVLSEIVERTDPDLVSFCPDIGWVRKVTTNIVEPLRIMESRIRLVHFKDYVADGVDEKENETEFGQGIMDFGEAFAFLRGLKLDELWVVAEQWKSSVNNLAPEEAIQRNIEFLKQFTDTGE